MRKVLALLALLAVVACWNGCSTSNPAPNTVNAPTSSKVGPESADGASRNSNTSGNMTKAPSPTGIKPPMKDEKK